MAKMIPIRPEGSFRLSAPEQNCITWYVLSGCSKTDAFSAFVRPDLAGSPTVLAQYATQFFSSQPAAAYMQAYSATIQNLLNPQKVESDKRKLTKEEQDERNTRAVQKVVDWVVANSENIDALEHPEELIKMMQRLGMLSDDTVTEEAPRRYLPQMCDRTCRYKVFCEQECIDECESCRYKKFANENGVEYAPENQLDKE